MNELQRLVIQLVEKCEAVHRIITKLGDLRFPSDSPRRLLTIIKQLVDAIEEQTLSSAMRTPSSAEDFTLQVKLLIRALDVITANLRFIERAATQHCPWSIICPLEQLGAKIHPDVHFIIRPQWSYNYSIAELVGLYRDYFSRFLTGDRLDQVFIYNGLTARRLYILGFPISERLNVLLHVMFGHELGHPIEKEYFDQEDFTSLQLAISLEVQRETGITGTAQPSLEQVVEAQQMLRKVLELRKRALAEIICDLVAVNIFGLAFVFAVEEFIASRDLDTLETRSNHYPPWRYRLRAIYQEVEPDWISRFKREGSFNSTVCDALDRTMNEIDALVSQTSDKTNITANPETRIAYQYVEQALPVVRTFVRDRLAANSITLDDLIGNTNGQMYDRLARQIPPDAYLVNNEEIPANMRTILNVGWLYRITQFKSVGTALISPEVRSTHANDMDILNRLLLKAIEYAHLRTIWHHNQSGVAGNAGPIQG